MTRFLPVFLLACFFSARLALAAEFEGKITRDTTWAGEISVSGDVIVVEGVTLAIAPGANIKVLESQSTKTDPEYLSPLTEITVRGGLRVEGTSEHPVRIGPEGDSRSWAGILADGGSVHLRHAHLSGAESAIYCMECRLEVAESTMTGNTYGLILQGDGAQAELDSVRVEDNRYGLMAFGGPRISMRGLKFADNEMDFHERPEKTNAALSGGSIRAPTAGEEALVLKEETTLLSDTVWRGRVVVENVVKVPPGVKLAIMPGTAVEFAFRDTDGDGIGENGILAQGTIWARGTRDNPVRFTSPKGRKGSWDAINLMASDRAQNLFENCIFEYAYRGLHSHFSLVGVRESLFSGNMRAMQFQFSEMDIRDSTIAGNTSGLQFRDSKVRMSGNLLADNYSGLNFLMSELVFRGNRVTGNSLEGMRARESRVDVFGNEFRANRRGIMLSGSEGTISGNAIEQSREDGLYVRNSKGLIERNSIVENGLNGASIDGLAGDLRNNEISRNGRDGVALSSMSGDLAGNTISRNGGNGISLKGMEGRIGENSIFANGAFNLDINTGSDVDARGNWWGSDEPGAIARGIHDGADEAGRGRASYVPYLRAWISAAVASEGKAQ